MSERDERDVEPTMATGAGPVAEMDWDGDMPELIRIGPQLQQPMIGPVVARNAANTELPLAMRPEDRFTQRQLQPAVNIFERMAEKRGAVAAAAGGGGAPELAAHERDRKIKQKTTKTPALGAPEPRRRGPGKERKTKEPNVTVGQRVREFPDNSLREQARKLYCACCKEVLCLIKSSITTHTKSPAHTAKLKKWSETLDDDATIKQNLVEYYREHPDEAMGSIDPATMVYRYRCVENALYAGIELAKLDYMKPTLERSGVSMADASSLAMAFVPKIEAAELEKTRRDLAGALFCNVFDGTRRLGEVVAMVSRFCTRDFEIKHRLTMFKTVKVHTSGKQLAQLVTRRLLTELELPASAV